MTAVYSPADGLLVLDRERLAGLIGQAHGRRLDQVTATDLVRCGVLRPDERVDERLVSLVDVLGGGGARGRLITRERGLVTVADVVLGADGGAVVLLWAAGADLAHVRWLSAGGVARYLGRRIGIGSHLGAEPRFVDGGELRDWRVIVDGFLTASPSGWVGRHRTAVLHELRWAFPAGAAAGTALVVAVLDRALVEVRPSDGDPGGYRVAAADPVAVWMWLCALTAVGDR
jgi:hypothetical protein